MKWIPDMNSSGNYHYHFSREMILVKISDAIAIILAYTDTWNWHKNDGEKSSGGPKAWIMHPHSLPFHSLSLPPHLPIPPSIPQTPDAAQSTTVATYYTEKTHILFPFKLNGIWSWWQFSFRFEPNGIPFGSKSKGKLSSRSYRIQYERKRKYSFLSAGDAGCIHCYPTTECLIFRQRKSRLCMLLSFPKFVYEYNMVETTYNMV